MCWSCLNGYPCLVPSRVIGNARQQVPFLRHTLAGSKLTPHTFVQCVSASIALPMLCTCDGQQWHHSHAISTHTAATQAFPMHHQMLASSANTARKHRATRCCTQRYKSFRRALLAMLAAESMPQPHLLCAPSHFLHLHSSCQPMPTCASCVQSGLPNNMVQTELAAAAVQRQHASRSQPKHENSHGVQAHGVKVQSGFLQANSLARPTRPMRARSRLATRPANPVIPT